MSEGQGNRHHTSLHLLARAVQCNFSQRQASREVWGHICWLALCGLLKHFTQLISLLIYTSINFSPFEFVVHGEGQSHVGSPRQLFSHLLVSYQFSFLGTQRFTKVCPHVTPICSSEPQRLWKMATLVPGRPHWLERRLTLVFQTRHNIVTKTLKCNGSYVHPNNDWKTKQSCNPRGLNALHWGCGRPFRPAIPAVPISTAGFEVEKKIHGIMEVLRLSQSQGSARSERPNTWARTLRSPQPFSWTEKINHQISSFLWWDRVILQILPIFHH